MELIIWIVMSAAVLGTLRLAAKKEKAEVQEIKPWYHEYIEELTWNCSRAKAAGDCWPVHHAKYCRSCDIIHFCKAPYDFQENPNEHQADDLIVSPEFTLGS